jgi:type II secretory pathway pseudopilin PulG
MKSHSRTRRSSSERGYALLTLLLVMALMIIVAATMAQTIKFQIERDREEEMIHRGVQYTRAIRAYYKKFNRYPVKLEDLESTNNLRFLRKRYKDPLMCKAGKCEDFKLLHFGEVQIGLSGMNGGGIQGATPVSAMGSSSSAGGFGGQSSSFGQSSFGQSSYGQSSGQSSTFGQSSSFGQSSGFGQSSTFGNSGGFGGNSSSGFGQNQNSNSQNSTSQNSSTNGTPSNSDSTTPGTGSPGDAQTSSSQPASGQIIGGPIVGVASTSKESTIREYNHKKKYKDWYFAYDPMQDQGRLITTPYQPQLQSFSAPNVNGATPVNGMNGGGMNGGGMNGANGSGFGNSFSSGSSSFGQGSGFSQSGFGNSGTQNNQNSPSQTATPSQPSNSPQQQQ